MSENMLELLLKSEKQFDIENEVIESALKQLLDRFPDNSVRSHVLLKTVVLNKLYNAQILDVESVAYHIVKCDIDRLLSSGDLSVVKLIANVRIGDKIRCNYSFATKYCSWHNPGCYPIYDSRADACLWAFNRKDRFFAFRRQELWEYGKYVEVIKAFQARYGLGSFSYKQVDKLLYQLGGRVPDDLH